MKKRISYRRLAILTNIKRSTLHDIVTEKTSPRLKDLEAIAEKLEVKITDLFESPYK
jgi:transcriptional regulator with XRE-family HTH domain